MRYRSKKGSQSVYTLYYHYVQVVKHRKNVFDNNEIVTS